MARDFTINDFRQQLDQIQKMGMKDTIRQLPGMAEMIPEGEDPEAALDRLRSMIDEMTEEERSNPDIIDSHRCSRIARTSGTSPQEVQTFLEQFAQVRETMRSMARMTLWQRLKMVMGFGGFPRRGGGD
jgi:signal recognition particle subunit SRP54